MFDNWKIPGSVGSVLALALVFWLGFYTYSEREINCTFSIITLVLLVSTIFFEVYTAKRDRKNKLDIEKEHTNQLKEILKHEKQESKIEWKK